MRLEKMVTTYEQSKKIKELGFKKGSIYKRHRLNAKDWDGDVGTINLQIHKVLWRNEEFVWFAYIAEELGEILPTHIEDKNYKYCLTVFSNDSGRHAGYENQIRSYLCQKWTTMAQAMGDMLIYLLENGLLPSSTQDA